MTDRIEVREPELVRHAGSIEAAGDRVAAVGRAGQAVRAGPESYGRWCALVPASLGVLQDVLIGAIDAAGAALHDTGARLRSTAEGYRAADQRRAAAFQALTGPSRR